LTLSSSCELFPGFLVMLRGLKRSRRYRVGGGGAANRMNANGDTPLAVSAWEGHLHIVTFLVAVGVELHVGALSHLLGGVSAVSLVTSFAR